MKLRSLATTILAAGGLLAVSGPSFAVPCATVPTVGAWAALGAGGCTDTDTDSVWVFTGDSGSVTAAVGFSVGEIELGGIDFYTFSLDWTPLNGTTAAGTLGYTVSSLNTEQFIAANFDTSVSEATGTSGAQALAAIAPGGLVLSSPDGARDPVTGETPLPGGPYSSLVVLDTFHPDLATPAGSAVLTGAINSFQVAVPRTIPEPATLLLLGAGLAGLGLVRRRKPR